MVVFADSANLQAKVDWALGKLLGGPVGVARAGDNCSEVKGTVGFPFHRGLDPLLGGETDHEAGLVEVMCRVVVQAGLEGHITKGLGVQQMAVVAAKTVVSSLPVVGVGFSGKHECVVGRFPGFPLRRFTVPREARVEFAIGKGYVHGPQYSRGCLDHASGGGVFPNIRMDDTNEIEPLYNRGTQRAHAGPQRGS